MTNRDKINAMSNKELARFIKDRQEDCDKCVLYNICENYEGASCVDNITEWLESEVDE